MKDNLIIYVSSRNNYDMLEGEVLRNIPFDGFEFINVDDNSVESEIEKGKHICNKYKIMYLQNRSRGVQMATQTLIDFVSRNRPNCKWIFCFQHDNFPISKDFFSRISKLINSGQIDQFGSIGFNVIDLGKNTKNSFNLWRSGQKPLGMIGMSNLGYVSTGERWIAPRQNQEILDLNKESWMKPFTTDFPMWAAIGINVSAWKNHVEPSTDYQFHLWWPDIAMQLNKANAPCIILPDLYCLNAQEIKSKYGIDQNSAVSAMRGNTHHFGEYGPHLENFHKRWGWEYENPRNTFPNVIDRYRGTYIEKFFNHELKNGPLENYDIEY